MKRRARLVKVSSAALVSISLIMLTAMVAVAPTAQAVASGAESASTPCVVSINAPKCQSTAPDLTVDIVNTGDTSACTFTFSINWGDESAAQQVTWDGKPQSGEYFLADHTYHATKMQTYSVAASSVSVTGNCTSGPGSYTFTLDIGGTAPVPSGEACVFNAPSTSAGQIGHVAWGFKLPEGNWEFGANEGPGKRGISKTWAKTGSQRTMLTTFLNGGPYHSTGYYTTLECVTIRDFKAASAQQEVGHEQHQRYILIFQDCESQVYNVLSKYGVSALPNDILHPVPNSWYNDLTTSAGFGPPTSL